MTSRDDLPNASDVAVVRRALGGTEAAYRELVRRYQRPVFSLLYRMVRDRELAEDLAQDTFVKVLNALDSYRTEYKFSSWVFKIANNTAIDHLRPRPRHPVARGSARRDQRRSRRSHIHSGRGPVRDPARGAGGEGVGYGHRGSYRKTSTRVSQLHRVAARRGTLVRGSRRDPRAPTGNREDLYPPGPLRIALVARSDQRVKPWRASSVGDRV